MDQHLDKNTLTTIINTQSSAAHPANHHRESHLRFVPASEFLQIGVEFPTSFLKLLLGAVHLSFYPQLPPLGLSVQAGAEAPQGGGGQTGNPVHCECTTVHGADVVCGFIWFPLSKVAELGEAQLLWLETQKRSNL